MDPTTMALILGGSTAIGGLGSFLGGNAFSNAGDQSREAYRRSVELGRNQQLINSQMMSPFVGAGMGALQELYGYSQVPGGYTGGAGENAFTVPTLNATGNRWDSPTTIGGVSYAKTGAGMDPTGGAGKYMGQLEGLSSNLNYKSYDPGQYIKQLEGYGQNFQFNENDPAYQYQKEIAARDINRQAAARGLYGSRAALNQLDESGRAITASEYDKQYGRGRQNIMDLYGMAGTEEQRGYGQAVDLYNRQRGNIVDLYGMAGQLGGTRYNALLDAVKIGTGAGATAGGLGNQGVGLTNSAYNQQAQNAFANAQGQANMYGGLAGTAMGGLNNYMLYNILMGKQG